MIAVPRWLLACAALCAFWPGPASAQQASQDLFTVSGVRVDQTSANAVQARSLGLAQAQRTGFERLAQRLTTPADQARLGGLPRPDDATLDRLVRGVDVEEQPRTSGTRYLGRFAVRFDPAGVTALLEGAGFTVLEARGAPVLIVPVLTAIQSSAPGAQTAADPWRLAWEQGGYARELVPLAVAPASTTGPAEWSSAADAAADAGAGSAIFALARVSGSSLTTDLVETRPDGSRVNRGQVSAPINGGDAGVPEAFRRLADAVNGRLQAEYKARPVQAQSGERRKLQVSALYSDMAEWSRIKEGLGAAGSVLTEIRIEAIAREGAIISFSHAGTPADLAVSLQRFGLQLSSTAIGPTLRAAPR